MKNNYIIFFIFLFVSNLAEGQVSHKKQMGSSVSYDSLLYNGLRWRSIGPWRGGRSLAVTGVITQPSVYYFGAAGGGVWKTSDAGRTWFCISDSSFHSSSVGAIAAAPGDPNILYVGMGEPEMRGNVSFGDGIYKSEDAGKSWRHAGLSESGAIANILVHPTNPNLVYASCMGKIFGTNSERGLYRSADGGKSWMKVLGKNDSTGCISAVFDPSNPKTMYASLWQSCRNPWSLSSGGWGSGIYKSIDGGDTWKEISHYPGLPVGMLGKIMLTTTPAKPEVVYASIENENGGIFRSDDRGEHWVRTTDDRNLRKRPWYFSTIMADPQNADVVWCLNVQLWKSTDGGRKFSMMPSMHGDHHDIWINPGDTKKMIIGDDGGGYVSEDGGLHYSEVDFPTAQFYHVSVDTDFPYNVYGAQQDNSSIKIPSSTDNYSIFDDHWYPVAGGEAGYIVPDPENPEITYGGEYDGQLSVYNKKNNQYRNISPWPESNPGHGSEDRKFRFNWTFPILISSFDSKTMYVTSQFVHRTHDGGNSWEIISPDLTRHDPATMKASGGPITKDNTGAEAFANIFTFDESPLSKGVFWAGSDDGLVHVSRDDGKTWTNVTPKFPNGYALISIIEASHFDQGTCYVAANRYKVNDNHPYLFKTNDYGVTWKMITKGIPANDFTRVIREDPNKRGVLYAGTETGIYVSFDDGENWQSLKLNLPVTPVHDIKIQNREKDLVIATHGRSFWILDDITPLYDLQQAAAGSRYLYKPRPAYRQRGGSYFDPMMQEGENGPHGVLLHYYFNDKPKKEITLKFFDSKNDTIITYSSTKDKKGEPVKIMKEFYQDTLIQRPGLIPARKGMNAFVWDMRYPDAKNIESGNNAMISGSLIGPGAKPGIYTVRLYEGDSLIASQPVIIKKDPRVQASQDDLDKQFQLLKDINKMQTETSEAINKIRKVSGDIQLTTGGIKDTVVLNRVKKITQPVLDSLKRVEEELTQPKAVTDYDLFNYPNKLNDKLAGLRESVESADAAPTQQALEVFSVLRERIEKQINTLNEILQKRLPAINQLLVEEKLFMINPAK